MTPKSNNVTMPKVKLTHQYINNMANPSKRTDYRDELKPGLELRVSPSGNKTFYFRYWGGKRRYKIGRYPDLSLAEARKRAGDLRIQVEQGIDPQGEKKIQKASYDNTFTFRNLADRFTERHLSNRKQKTIDFYKWILNKYLIPAFGDSPVESIQRREIIDVLEDIATDKPTLANRVHAVMSSVLNYGLKRDYIPANPIHNLGKFGTEQKRERTLSDEEIQKVWQAFEAQNEPLQTLFKLLLLLGQRSGETMKMKWGDISAGTWTIPATDTKNADSHQVPLPDYALELLENIRPLTGKQTYVFTSQSSRGDGHIKWIQKAVQRIKESSGIDFRIHDLRRTAATNMAKNGIDRTTLGKVLNHGGLSGDRSVTAVYDKHTYHEAKQQALQLWANQLKRVVHGEQSANVYKIGS